MGSAGSAFTVTTTGVRELSHPLVWLTYQVVVPKAVVEGTGAAEAPTPPLETVYQSKPLPEAVNAEAAAF